MRGKYDEEVGEVREVREVGEVRDGVLSTNLPHILNIPNLLPSALCYLPSRT